MRRIERTMVVAVMIAQMGGLELLDVMRKEVENEEVVNVEEEWC